MNAEPDLDGAAVKAARKARRWSQAQLAEFLGVSQPTVCKIERNERPISGPISKLLHQIIQPATPPQTV